MRQDTTRCQRTNASKTLDFPLDCDPTTAIWGKSIPFPPRTPADAKMSCKRFTSGTKPLPSVCVCCRPAPPSAEARTRWCDMVRACVCLRCTRVRSFEWASMSTSNRAWINVAFASGGQVATFVEIAKWQHRNIRPSMTSWFVAAVRTRVYKQSSYVSSSILLYVLWIARVERACVRDRSIGWLVILSEAE